MFKDTKDTKCSRPIPCCPAVSLTIVRNSDVISNWVGGAQSVMPAGVLMSQMAETPKHTQTRRGPVTGLIMKHNLCIHPDRLGPLIYMIYIFSQ